MNKCKNCICNSCSHCMDENYERLNKLDCTMCSWCKGELIKQNCSNYNNKISEVNNDTDRN